MKIYTYSILFNTFDAYADKLPYVVAIVEDEDGKRYSAYVDGYEEGMSVKVGDEVTLVGKSETGSLICKF